MRTKLEPCPFCNSENVEISTVIFGTIPIAKCHECGAVVSFNNDDVNYFPEHFMRYWNRRADDENKA